LTDAIELLLRRQPVCAWEFEGDRYDTGTPSGWLENSAAFALDPSALTEEASQIFLEPLSSEKRQRPTLEPKAVREDAGRQTSTRVAMLVCMAKNDSLKSMGDNEAVLELCDRLFELDTGSEPSELH
jgi:hypothetical protein